eukprot:NODE_1802_length_1063_cov_75.288955_g1470_i0.p1 GENE.NODE_1802_length_1063_cov_75.288955_g1470_i0~~NODE_1802_length_1063_cov_75.288955_g1470_i0.p1  ORF type:complete len:235 (+),score=37.50 NODE_1802_length_1063_cov_75.288955_g1470_i0:57-761(+)
MSWILKMFGAQQQEVSCIEDGCGQSKDETKEGHLAVLKRQSEETKEELRAMKDQLLETQKRMSEAEERPSKVARVVNRSCHQRTPHVITFDGIADLLRRSESELQVYSEPFAVNLSMYMCSEKYELREVKYIMRVGLNLGPSMFGISLATIPGDDDEFLDWPFRTPFTISLLEPGTSQGKVWFCSSATLSQAASSANQAFKKGSEEGFGPFTVEADDLMRKYIVNDRIAVCVRF